jgi:hypothetical protein
VTEVVPQSSPMVGVTGTGFTVPVKLASCVAPTNVYRKPPVGVISASSLTPPITPWKTILSSMGKAAPQIDGIGCRILFQAIEKDALSLDDLVPRVVERKPFRAVHLGDADEPSTLRWPFDFARYALDTGGIEIASHGKRCDSLAPSLNSLAKRKKGTGGTKAGLFFKLPYGSRFCCFVVAIFALRDGPAVAVLVAPEWSARVDEQNHRLAAGVAKHEDTRATPH